MLGEVEQEVGGSGQYRPDRVEQGYPDGELHQHGHDAAHGAYPRLFVEPHLLRTQLLPALGVFLLHLFQLGLKGTHGPGGLELPYGKGKGDNTDKYGKGDDGQAEVVEQDAVEHDKPVEHGVKEEGVPKRAYHYSFTAFSTTSGRETRHTNLPVLASRANRMPCSETTYTSPSWLTTSALTVISSS